MKHFLYVLLSVMAITGAYIYFYGDSVFVSWIHYIAGFSLLAIFLLYASDHTTNYRRYIMYINYAMISGFLLWITGLLALFSGLFVFFYEAGQSELPDRIHLILSVLFCVNLVLHLIKKKKWYL